MCFIISSFASTAIASNLLVLRAYASNFDFNQFVVSANKSADKSSAYKKLLNEPDNNFTYENLQLKYFLLGSWAFELKKNSEARAHLQIALKFGSLQAAQIHFIIGQTYKAEADYKNANDSFQRVLDFIPSQFLVLQSRLELSEIALLTHNYRRASEQLRLLERRWKGTPNYPDILWKLMSVEFKDNRRHLACQWARKLYSRYPSFKEIQDWGVHFQENKFEGNSIGCLASDKDTRNRIKYLSLSGLVQKARAEIDLLRSEARPNEKYEADLMLAYHLEGQGYPDEAFKILIPFYNEQKNNPNFQSLLGKVATRAGDYQSAIGLYLKVNKLSPRSSFGKEALFTAAYLSYQIQDYDGATRKFHELIHRYAGSKFARDAKWHLAWIQYLKSDYAVAENSFRNLMNEKQFQRRHRFTRPYMNSRTQYWLAMALLKQNKFEDARLVFLKLTNEKGLGYYSFLAKNRLIQLNQMVPAAPERFTSSLAKNTASVDEVTNEDSTIEAEATERILTPAQLLSAKVKDSEDSEVNVASSVPESTGDSEGSDSSGDDSDNADKDESGSESVNSPAILGSTSQAQFEAPADESSDVSETEQDKVKVTSFKDPKLRERFQRASNLSSLGFKEWAKWELFEIERRTSNKIYLKMLMESYEKIGSYNRTEYISEVYFSNEREKIYIQNRAVAAVEKKSEINSKKASVMGADKIPNISMDDSAALEDQKTLWRYNFPKAFQENVDEYSSKFNVSNSLILSIMRAESQFNKDAYSPVGARGLMQIMPYTADQIAKLLGEQNTTENDLFTPNVNIRLGTRYLQRLQKTFENQVPLIAAAYNAGPHRVFSWLNNFGTLEMDEFIEHVPFNETRNYIKKVLRNYVIYTELYKPNSEPGTQAQQSLPSGIMNSYPSTYSWLTSPISMRASRPPSQRESWEGETH